MDDKEGEEGVCPPVGLRLVPGQWTVDTCDCYLGISDRKKEKKTLSVSHNFSLGLFLKV